MTRYAGVDWEESAAVVSPDEYFRELPGGWRDIEVVVEGDMNVDMTNRCRILRSGGADDGLVVEIEVHGRGDRLVVVLPFRLEDEELPNGGAKRFEVSANRVISEWFENQADETWYFAERVEGPMRGIR